MARLTRRDFNLVLGATSVTAGLGASSGIALAVAKPRVVVIGGGAGGATAARYIAKGAKGAVDVTLIEPKKSYTTCFFSNYYLGGYRTWESITHSYDKLASSHGIKVVHQAAESINREKKEVVLTDRTRVPYDRLVVSPGISIEYDSVPGYSEKVAEVMPHAWNAGPQTKLLKAKLDALKDGENIIMVAPPNPYRCPPGPYERASMMAHVLTAKGHTKSKIFILDVKDSFSKQPVFAEGWEKHYPGMVEWIGPGVHGGIKNVDAKKMEVSTDLDVFKGALINILPAQKAGVIAIKSGLADAKGFCPIDPETMQSKMDPNIHVIGDSCIGGDMPKSAFSANSQAKVAAMAILAALNGSQVFPAKFANTCWSLIDTGDAIKVGGSYAPNDGKIAAVTTFVSKPGEDATLHKLNAEEAVGWYNGITADMFS
jgi:NADPH-dependent 2,4-dienoyl-CoA reductase/sulfur reductase-like enzyme